MSTLTPVVVDDSTFAEQLEPIACKIETTATTAILQIASDAAKIHEAFRYHRNEGGFVGYMKKRLGYSSSTAYRLLNVHTRFGKNVSHAWETLPVSAIYLLAEPSTPEEAFNEIAGRIEAGNRPTVAEVRSVIKRAKGTSIENHEETPKDKAGGGGETPTEQPIPGPAQSPASTNIQPAGNGVNNDASAAAMAQQLAALDEDGTDQAAESPADKSADDEEHRANDEEQAAATTVDLSVNTDSGGAEETAKKVDEAADFERRKREIRAALLETVANALSATAEFLAVGEKESTWSILNAEQRDQFATTKRKLRDVPKELSKLAALIETVPPPGAGSGIGSEVGGGEAGGGEAGALTEDDKPGAAAERDSDDGYTTEQVAAAQVAEQAAQAVEQAAEQAAIDAELAATHAKRFGKITKQIGEARAISEELSRLSKVKAYKGLNREDASYERYVLKMKTAAAELADKPKSARILDERALKLARTLKWKDLDAHLKALPIERHRFKAKKIESGVYSISVHLDGSGLDFDGHNVWRDDEHIGRTSTLDQAKEMAQADSNEHFAIMAGEQTSYTEAAAAKSGKTNARRKPADAKAALQALSKNWNRCTASAELAPLIDRVQIAPPPVTTAEPTVRSIWRSSRRQKPSSLRCRKLKRRWGCHRLVSTKMPIFGRTTPRC